MIGILEYVVNLEAQGGINKKCSGVLIYPTVDEEVNDHFDALGRDVHDIQVKTINLNQNWKNIKEDLLKIVEA